MDKKQLQEFISAIGSIAETALLFYRSTLAAKATPEETAAPLRSNERRTL